MSTAVLRRVTPRELEAIPRAVVDAETLVAATSIVEDVRRRGEAALLDYAERFDGWVRGTPWIHERSELRNALEGLSRAERDALTRLAGRIAAFAQAQREALREVELPVPGGRAGHRIVPIQRAGCYAPAGRYPLPSSLLMGAVTARVAGVSDVVVATPRPGQVMLGAAAIAGADAVVAVGGAQAVAAMAFGIGIAPRDIIVGPGNRWVTAAKKHVAGEVAIDFLAGPSELVVVADDSADPAAVAADLLAQAEHDADAAVVLVTDSSEVVDAVERELVWQLRDLTTSPAAIAALRKAVAVVCDGAREIAAVCDHIAPEHLQLSVRDPVALAGRLRNAGALFLGAKTSVVFGDYGVGGNHVLPTAGSARFAGGLSVLNFLRVQTWLDLGDPARAARDVAALARMEGLEAHARAVERER